MKRSNAKSFLQPREYKEIDFDSVEASEKAIEIMRTKKCLHDVYVEKYRLLMKEAVKNLKLSSDSKILEIGSGGGFIKDIFPNVITSDIKPLSNIDIIINAERLPFDDNELGAIFAVHTIHHIPDIDSFLQEATRVLKSGGGMVCIEPYWGLVARFLYKNLHPEPFDEKAAEWNLTEPSGPMSGSNQALSYIMLKRDRALFLKKHQPFEIIRSKRFGFIRYFCTGGIWLNQILPDFCFPFLKVIEVALKPFMPLLAIHHVFILRKRL